MATTTQEAYLLQIPKMPFFITMQAVISGAAFFQPKAVKKLLRIQALQ